MTAPADARSAVGERGHAGVRPAPGLRTPPPLEPRYDDEHPPDGGPAVGELLPFDEPSPRRLERDVDFFDPQPTSRRALPDPGPWAAHFVQAVLEVMAGRRPVGQLQRLATPPAVPGVRSAARRWAGRTDHARRNGRAGQACATGRTAQAGQAGQAGQAHRPGPAAAPATPADTAHSVHVSEPADGVAEVCAVVRQGQRYRALAARLEGLDGRWQCVSFRML